MFTFICLIFSVIILTSATSHVVDYQIHFFKVSNVDLRNSEMSIPVIITLSWPIVEPLHQNLSFISPYQLNWVPQVTLLDRGSLPFIDTFNHMNTLIYIESNSTYIWRLRGTLTPRCSFKDLSTFPYDKIKCTFRMRSLNFMTTLLPLSWSDGDSGEFNNFGSSFQHYQIETISQSLIGNIDISYDVQLNRSSIFYFLKLIIPCILVAYITFLGFWVSPVIDGIRLDVSLQAIFAMVTLGVIMSEFLPVTNSRLLLDELLTSSMFFAFFVVVESAIAFSLYYRTTESIPIYGFIVNKTPRDIIEGLKIRIVNPVHRGITSSVSQIKSRLSSTKNIDTDDEEEEEYIYKTKPLFQNLSLLAAYDQYLCPYCSPEYFEYTNAEFHYSQNTSISCHVPQSICHHISKYRERLDIYLIMFYELDMDYSGELDLAEISDFVSFITSVDYFKDLQEDLINIENVRTIDFIKFVSICESHLFPDGDIVFLSLVNRGFSQMLDRQKLSVIERFKFYSRRVDSVARWLFPLAFSLLVIGLFSKAF